MSEMFLVEIGTEELPPKSLLNLIQAFESELKSGLAAAGLSYGACQAFASPRRLALQISDLAAQTEEKCIERLGPSRFAALNAEGKPSPAGLGFARTCGVSFEELSWTESSKGEVLVFRSKQAARKVEDLLPGIIEQALQKLPISKTMRWADHEFSFVRPVSWLLMLLGAKIVPAEILGLKSDRITWGHRIHHPSPIVLASAQDYEMALERAYVLASFEGRKQKIRAEAKKCLEAISGVWIENEALLEEVTAIVEWPVPLLGSFDSRFLSVPQAALISAMQGHQKCFALSNASGEMLPKFLMVANLESQDPEAVICGNERVMRARLSDAEFFYQKDLKIPLSERLARLSTVSFQAKLGSLQDKVLRLIQLSQYLAEKAKVDLQKAQRAAELSKADLVSEMVVEFPELQGIMGEIYARASGENEAVCLALREQYFPRFSGDALPESMLGKILALADRVDTLVGIFAIGLKPTGSKDPFALRRAMIGILRLSIEGGLSINIFELFRQAQAGYGHLNLPPDLETSLQHFALERLKGYWLDAGKEDLELMEELLALKSGNFYELSNYLSARETFSKLPEAQTFLRAMKRAKNLIEKFPRNYQVDSALFSEPAEKVLWDAFSSLKKELIYSKGHLDYLQAFVPLGSLIESFLNEVTVLSESNALRETRLGMVQEICQKMRFPVFSNP